MSQITKVFVGSLPPQVKPEELRHLFSNYGIVVECDVMNRCGFVHMETFDMAETAIAALHGTEFKGQQIVVEPGRPKDRKGSGGGGGGGNRGTPRGEGNSNRGSGGGRGGPGPMQSNFGRSGGRPGGGQSSGNFSNNHGSGPVGGNSFGGSRGGSGGGNFLNNSVGPIRNQGINKQQHRNAPYSGPRGNMANSDRPTQHGFNPNVNAGSRQFGGSNTGNQSASGSGGFNNSSGGRFGSGNSGNQFQQSWNNNDHGNINSSAKRNLPKSNYSGGFSGNNSGNDFSTSSSNMQRGAPQNIPRGTLNNQRGIGGGNNLGQDRRGFALPAADQQHQFAPSSNQGRFGNTPSMNGNDDNGRFQRSNNQSNNMGSSSSNNGRGGGFGPNRGGFSSRPGGNFPARHGSFNAEQAKIQHQLNSNSRNMTKTYQTEFPPLAPPSGARGGMNRNMPPRQNAMPNRRFQ